MDNQNECIELILSLEEEQEEQLIQLIVSDISDFVAEGEENDTEKVYFDEMEKEISEMQLNDFVMMNSHYAGSGYHRVEKKNKNLAVDVQEKSVCDIANAFIESQENCSFEQKPENFQRSNNSQTNEYMQSKPFKSNENKFDKGKDEKTIYEKIIIELRKKHHFVNFYKSLLIYESGSYKQLKLQDFKIFSRRIISDNLKYKATGQMLQEAYDMLVAEVKEISNSDFEKCSHFLTFLDGNMDVRTLKIFPHHPEIYTLGTIPARLSNC